MTVSPAFQSQSSLRPLPFDPSKLKGLSERARTARRGERHEATDRLTARQARRTARSPPISIGEIHV